MGELERLAELRHTRDQERAAKATANEKFPLLTELLRRDVYRGNEQRLTSDFSVADGVGGFEIAYRDHEEGKRCVVVVPALTDILKALEQAVRDPDTTWHRYKSFKRKMEPKAWQKNLLARNGGPGG